MGVLMSVVQNEATTANQKVNQGDSYHILYHHFFKKLTKKFGLEKVTLKLSKNQIEIFLIKGGMGVVEVTDSSYRFFNKTSNEEIASGIVYLSDKSSIEEAIKNIEATSMYH